VQSRELARESGALATCAEALASMKMMVFDDFSTLPSRSHAGVKLRSTQRGTARLCLGLSA